MTFWVDRAADIYVLYDAGAAAPPAWLAAGFLPTVSTLSLHLRPGLVVTLTCLSTWDDSPSSLFFSLSRSSLSFSSLSLRSRAPSLFFSNRAAARAKQGLRVETTRGALMAWRSKGSAEGGVYLGGNAAEPARGEDSM